MKENPSGRLDIAVKRLAEELCRIVERNMKIRIWPHVESTVDQLIDQYGIPREPVDFPLTVATNLGIVKRKRQRPA